MNKHKITKRQLLHCLKTVQAKCESSEVWFGDSFREYCSNPHNIKLLQTLQCMNAVQLSDLNGNAPPVYVRPLDSAGIIWYENSEKWKDRIWGFVFGILTGVIVTVVAQVIMKTTGIV